MWRILSCALILTLAAFSLPGAQPVAGSAKSTYVVTNTADSGAGSLRKAINDANAIAGADEIHFNIDPLTDPGCSVSTGVCTIKPATPLPWLIDNAGVTIDGYTQPGSVYATATTPATLKIRLDGSDLVSSSVPDIYKVGLALVYSNNKVRGLAILNCPSYGIYIGKIEFEGSWYGAPYYNTVSGNFIGVDTDGVTPRPNGGGVGLAFDANLNLIGGSTHAGRNIISGNSYEGVYMVGGTVHDNIVSANYIGLNAAGTAAVPNGRYGVWLASATHNNYIGLSNQPNYRNVISGNAFDNVRLSGSGTTDNGVLGNFIGTNAAGDAALGGLGVVVANGAINNGIGSVNVAHGNLISGNLTTGIYLADDTVQGTGIANNWIGLNATGTGALPNGTHGIHLGGASYNFIGSSVAPNVISGNTQAGIYIVGSQAVVNMVRGNYIGTSFDGMAAVPNLKGVFLSNGANTNLIGGDNVDEGNVISGNMEEGVVISGAGTDNNLVMGNLIGLSADGLSALGNQEGVYISIGAQENVIGGDDEISNGDPGTFSRNVISGNRGINVFITGLNTKFNRVTGNYIGTDITGMAAATMTGSSGVYIQDSASYNVIGACNEFEGNVISGNPSTGVSINFGTDYNTLGCNRIGVAAEGDVPLGNNGYGVDIGSNARFNKIGNYNMIANNAWDGVHLMGADNEGNEITRNYIYNNGALGIFLNGHANNDILPPTISGATLGGGPGDDDTVSGTACASCWVEVFGNPTMDGEGQEYIGRVQAAAVGGAFTLSGITLEPEYPHLTATAWGSGDGTSQFSAVYTAPFNFIYLPVVCR